MWWEMTCIYEDNEMTNLYPTTNDPHEASHPPDTDAEEDLEPWVEWIKRCTHEAEEKCAN